MEKIDCPTQLLNITTSFHDDTKGIVSYEGQPFVIRHGVKQGCVLAPTLFGIFSSQLLSFAFRQCKEAVHLHTRSDGNLFNLVCLKAKSKICQVLIRKRLFADDAALISHSEDDLQQIISRFVHACKEFGLTINIKKANIFV